MPVTLSVGGLVSERQTAEAAVSRLLKTYIMTGLFFMLVPGTLIGVWNLISISSAHAPDSASSSWIQAHGHAQIFGWIGSFILGIGFYSIPRMRGLGSAPTGIGWWTWLLWTSGVLLRWTADMWGWGWRLALPLSAGLELAAFLVFFKVVSGHRSSERKEGLPPVWVLLVIAATFGLLVSLALNLAGTVYVATRGTTSVFPHTFNQRFLTTVIWAALVVLVWGFSTRWLPPFLSLKPTRDRLLLAALGLNAAGVILAIAGATIPSMALLAAATVVCIYALRLFETPRGPAKTQGIHPSFPVFVRIAYVWLLISAALAVWASLVGPAAAGIWGASRHAVTVGFLSTMVFCIGPRVLPAFAGVSALFSKQLMFASLLLLTAGCSLRVTGETIAYQGFGDWAWSWLPISAVIELAAVTVFAVNMGATMSQSRAT
ncbi:MAG TPA: NnrS family protein [Acidobacteriota bacterium]|nr:NnrS family protein [Acidobacteriota bacterium]